MAQRKKAISVKILPRTLATADDETPLYVFKKHKRKNPYSEIVDNFLKRQLIIASHFTLITAVPLREHLNFLGYIILVTDQQSKQLVTPENRIIINKKNKTQKLKYLQNYLAMSLIAQSFENFEAFIRDMYRAYLRLNIKVAPALDVAMQQIPRRNSEVLKALKTFFPSLSTYLIDRKYSWIKVMENIRHCIVHTDQLISETVLKSGDRQIYLENFDFKKVKGGKYRVTVDKHAGSVIIKHFDNIGYNIFSCASHDAKYSIELRKKTR